MEISTDIFGIILKYEEHLDTYIFNGVYNIWTILYWPSVRYDWLFVAYIGFGFC